MSDLSIEANLRELRATRSASMPQLLAGLIIGIAVSVAAAHYGPALVGGNNGPLSTLIAIALAISLSLSIVHLILLQRAKEREIKSRLMLIESELLDMRLSNGGKTDDRH